MSEKNVRMHIANLAAAIKHFHPAEPLVNERDIPKKFTPDEAAPTLDQLVGLCIGAIYDVQEFSRNYMKLKNNYMTLYSDGMIAHQTAMAAGVSCPGLSEVVETLIGKLNQSLDVIKNIGDNSNDPEIQNVCRTYLKRFERVPNGPIDSLPGTSPDAQRAN
jgi:hypothetical protein